METLTREAATRSEHSHEKMYLISLKIAGVIMTSATWEVKRCLYFPLLFDEYSARTKNRTFPPSDCTVLLILV